MSAIAEVLESTSTSFLAELYSDEFEIEFGSVVKIFDEQREFPVWGVVTNIFNQGTYERQPVAFGMSRTELTKTHPQLTQLLKTRFEAIIIGYGDVLDFSPNIPTKPPLIHDQAQLLDDIDFNVLGNNLSFLRFLFLSESNLTDELVFKLISKIYEIEDRNLQILVKAGKEISLNLQNDYERIRKIISRFETLIQNGE
ncbi:MAG: hypothetical protein DWQ06_07770 [Calditrichaeota bacterium]|nr:MAG: hypothetical protein DWQ06_07770 [Calditrichota bacterium]